MAREVYGQIRKSRTAFDDGGRAAKDPAASPSRKIKHISFDSPSRPRGKIKLKTAPWSQVGSLHSISEKTHSVCVASVDYFSGRDNRSISLYTLPPPLPLS